MHLNANQARRPVSPESYLSSLPDIPVSQPVQHSSAFIFISRGAPSCHRPGESAPRISPYVCKALTQTHGTQEVPLWKFATFIVLLMLHCHRTHAHTTVSFGNFNIKGFKCQIFTSIIHRQRISSLNTLYPQEFLRVFQSLTLSSFSPGSAQQEEVRP